MNDYDVAIVGGRVAGASTALLLARAGLRVAVLERSRAGSDTLSTHALMRAGVLQLSRWGVLPDLIAAGTPAIRSIVFHFADGENSHVALRPSPGVDALYAPRRYLLDRVLIEAAAASGADVLHETPVIGLLRGEEGRVLGVRAFGADRREVPLRAALTIGADGVGSHGRARGRGTAREPRPSGQRDPLPLRRTGGPRGLCLGIRSWSGRGPDPHEAGETCVFVSTTPERMHELRTKGAETAFDSLLDAVPHAVSALVRAGGKAGHLHGWRGMPGHIRHSFGPGWALVGDAGYYKDPITTHGLTDALRDAELLADAVLVGGLDASTEFALTHYQDTRDRLSKALVDVTESVSRYDWDGDRIRTLLRGVSSAMSDELEHLSAHLRP